MGAQPGAQLICQIWRLCLRDNAPGCYRPVLEPIRETLPMDCPHCQCTETRQLKRTTDLGYTVFRCRGCGRTFNERTGTPFNFVGICQL